MSGQLCMIVANDATVKAGLSYLSSKLKLKMDIFKDTLSGVSSFYTLIWPFKKKKKLEKYFQIQKRILIFWKPLQLVSHFCIISAKVMSYERVTSIACLSYLLLVSVIFGRFYALQYFAWIGFCIL